VVIINAGSGADINGSYAGRKRDVVRKGGKGAFIEEKPARD
jgi:hypothetical protein